MWVAAGAAALDVSSLAAFTVAGHQAVTMRAGICDHMPIALQGGDFVIVERQTAQADCEFATLAAWRGKRRERPDPGFAGFAGRHRAATRCSICIGHAPTRAASRMTVSTTVPSAA